MKRWIVLLGGVVCLASSGCLPPQHAVDAGAEETLEQTAPGSQLDTMAPIESSADLEPGSTGRSPEILERVVVHRWELEHTFDEPYYAGSSGYAVRDVRFPVVRDIMDLFWICRRGGCGIAPGEEGWPEAIEATSASLPAVQASALLIREGGITNQEYASLLQDPQFTETVWIRLVFEPFLEPDGIGRTSHKDILAYIVPDNQDDAFLAIQNPEDLDMWSVYTMPGYCQWLVKELDVLLRMQLAQ